MHSPIRIRWYILSVFFSSKCSLFHNSNVFGSCIIHILYTGCAKIKKNNSGPKRLTAIGLSQTIHRTTQITTNLQRFELVAFQIQF